MNLNEQATSVAEGEAVADLSAIPMPTPDVAEPEAVAEPEEEADDGRSLHGIRPATLDDVEAMIGLGAEFANGGDYWGEHRPFSPVDFAHHLIALVRSPLCGFFVAENDAGEIVGAFAVLVTNDVFAGGKRAMKLHWFVRPDYRGIGLRLERRGRQWAAERGAGLLTMSAVNEAGCQLLERLGYTRVEVLYLKAI